MVLIATINHHNDRRYLGPAEREIDKVKLPPAGIKNKPACTRLLGNGGYSHRHVNLPGISQATENSHAAIKRKGTERIER